MVTIDSIRQRTLKLWTENPYYTPKKICVLLKLNHKKHGNYIRKLLSEFRRHYDFGSPLKPHRRIFVWKGIGRSENLPVGWVVVSNRNDMWIFRDDLGSVHWYKGGLVRLYTRGEVHLARVKELFCKAFYWFKPFELKKYLDVPLREESRHWVFELGGPVPRFNIRTFERGCGIRIFTDGSHPHAIEVEETAPFWLGEFRDVTRSFGLEIAEHLKLIRMWQGEAKAFRLGVKRRRRIKDSPSQKSMLEWMI